MLENVPYGTANSPERQAYIAAWNRKLDAEQVPAAEPLPPLETEDDYDYEWEEAEPETILATPTETLEFSVPVNGSRRPPGAPSGYLAEDVRLLLVEHEIHPREALLQAYVDYQGNRHRNQRSPVIKLSSLRTRFGVQQKTINRWLQHLAELGLLTYEHDHVRVTLTATKRSLVPYLKIATHLTTAMWHGNLDAAEVLLLAEINALECHGGTCFASTQYLAKRFGFEKSHVKKKLRSLRRREWLESNEQQRRHLKIGRLWPPPERLITEHWRR